MPNANYHANMNPAERNSSHILMLETVGFDKAVLDVGCASGYLAAALAQQGCRVSGVEIDAEAAEQARPHLEKLVVGDVTKLDLAAEFGEGVFDVVVFGDVLEHLANPEPVLQSVLRLLRPGGSVVISIPNVAHGSLRLALLQGRWEYKDAGLLDRTHLRFFTRSSLAEMLAAAGLQVEVVKATVLDPLEADAFVDDEVLPSGVVQWVRDQPEAFVYQFVLRAVIGDPFLPWPRLDLAAEIPRVDDAHRRRAMAGTDVEDVAAQRDALFAEAVQLRRTVLTLRDHAMGASAEIGRLRATVAKCEQQVGVLTRERDSAAHDLAQVRASLSWRVGNALVRPFAAVRRRIVRAARRFVSGVRG